MEPINNSSSLITALDSMQSAVQGVTIDDSPVVNKQSCTVSDPATQANTVTQAPPTLEESLQKAVNDIVSAVFKAISAVIDSVLSAIKQALPGATPQDPTTQTGTIDAPTGTGSTINTGADALTSATDSAATPTDTLASTFVDNAAFSTQTKKKKKHGLFGKIGNFFKKMIKGANNLVSGAQDGVSLLKDPKSWLDTLNLPSK